MTTPQTIAHYNLLERLGEGGIGEVLSRPRHQGGPHRGAQAGVAGNRRGAGAAGAVARGRARRGDALPSEHRDAVGRRRGRRLPLPRLRVHLRPSAARGKRRRRAESAPGARSRDPDRRRRRRGARARRHPRRPAPRHDRGDREGQRQDPRFRHGSVDARRACAHACRAGAGRAAPRGHPHRLLYVSRRSDRQRGRRAHRRLFDRHADLRAGDGTKPVRGRHRVGHDRQPDQGRHHAAVRSEPGGSRRSRCDRLEGAVTGHRQPPAERGGPRGGTAHGRGDPRRARRRHASSRRRRCNWTRHRIATRPASRRWRSLRPAWRRLPSGTCSSRGGG